MTKNQDDGHSRGPPFTESPPQKSLVMTLVKEFYENNPQIKESHGISHVLSVHYHAVQAIACHKPSLTETQAEEVESAALLHDVDDSKYFPGNESEKPNAKDILKRARVSNSSTRSILEMIELVSTSRNGNSVPPQIESSGEYFRLIPRWADRLEAVGVKGVIRCYHYTLEKGQALSSDVSPRAKTEAEVWKLADPQRFADYQASGGYSRDMISHYYDKLLHVARPPPDIVRNQYLEDMASISAQPLVHVCTRFGLTDCVDEEFLRRLSLQTTTSS